MTTTGCKRAKPLTNNAHNIVCMKGNKQQGEAGEGGFNITGRNRATGHRREQRSSGHRKRGPVV